jgi:hypothetical protein
VLAALESGKVEGWPKGAVGAADFFAAVRAHTVFGFLCDPSYGGNRDYVGWKVVGYPGRQHHRGATRRTRCSAKSDRPRVERVEIAGRTPAMTDVLRIANCSGFYGDRLSAAREMVEGGPIDVLTGDYLAELTLMILLKDKQKDRALGYARTFLRQLEESRRLQAARHQDRRERGGLNPAGCADAARRPLQEARRERRRRAPRRATTSCRSSTRSAVRARSSRTSIRAGALSALGGARCSRPTRTWRLGHRRGARARRRLVDLPRVTDAALTLGPAAWKFGWKRDDWDQLAAGVVAGHIIECGAQTTGGNYAFFKEVPDLTNPGFPIAEMRATGSFVITKHAGTGGLVSVGTVTAQLLYEIGGPLYPNPTSTARFDTIQVEQDGPDRVLVHGIKGEPPPPTTKVCINYFGGYKNSMTFMLTGLDIEEKAKLAEDDALEARRRDASASPRRARRSRAATVPIPPATRTRSRTSRSA